MSLSAAHLNVKKQVNQGSFYTPEKFVTLASKWLRQYGLDSSWTILDSSCGYGAFFNLSSSFPKNRYIGNDIDSVAVRKAQADFPFIESFQKNALSGVSRKVYRLSLEEKLCVVGNPPYNDVTSELKSHLKTDRIPIPIFIPAI